MKQILFTFFAVFAIFSCDSDDPNKTAPKIPAVETMVVDFGFFDDVEKSAQSEKSNWVFSATTVGVWSFIVGTTFAVPVAAFKSAIAAEPSVVDPLTWQWEFNVEGFSAEYNARLVGKLQSVSQVNWEMYISKTGNNPFEDFLWFEGSSNIDRKSGQWILFHSPAFPEEVVQIDWIKNEDEVGEIKYTYVRKFNNQRESDMFSGSVLTYGLQKGEMDVFMNINAYDLQQNAFKETFIEWSRTGVNGHVKAEHFFNDSNWHCWDAERNDKDCN